MEESQNKYHLALLFLIIFYFVVYVGLQNIERPYALMVTSSNATI